MKLFKLKTFSIVAFYSLLFSFLFIACGGSRKVFTPPQSTEKIVTVKEIVRDTVFQTHPDSSMLQALMECQNGKAVIKEIIKSDPGKSNLQPPKIQFKDNILTVDCEAKVQKLFATWKEKHKQETVTVTKTEYKEIQKKLTKWQTLSLWVGQIIITLFISACLVYLMGLGLKKLK
ncbi:hypothetical protein Ga0061079_11620 [Apibacter mensalis]|uniref:Lipoprotein n=1 Tax=Apibacter mensalis TaxID=1586267 RepID=A0A0X3ATA8_9FLAO|nr:hypothetical protein [Apibacter mensalis]CVK17118.1 hypothetical protein Ga0061079_11620 [Apibacter mensalis]